MVLDFCVYFNELLVVIMTELYGLRYFVSEPLKKRGNKFMCALIEENTLSRIEKNKC